MDIRSGLREEVLLMAEGQEDRTRNGILKSVLHALV